MLKDAEVMHFRCGELELSFEQEPAVPTQLGFVGQSQEAKSADETDGFRRDYKKAFGGKPPQFVRPTRMNESGAEALVPSK